MIIIIKNIIIINLLVLIYQYYYYINIYIKLVKRRKVTYSNKIKNLY